MLKLKNSMTGKLEVFKSMEPELVRIFTCGPSIYRRPHIGNYRTFLYEDILLRYLEYKGYQVKRIINFTDLEDKTIEESLTREKKLEDITAEASGHFFRESAELNIKLPVTIPSSSTSVAEAVKIIKKLIEKGHAYIHDKDVFFDPLTYPGFGRLYGLDMSSWPAAKRRFRRDTYNGNRWNKGDFILWHADRGEHIHFWETEIGKGRPSWNVQDPAMIIKHLGEQIDINCGGIDNIYRHHDYNIAVMEAFSSKEFAGYYLHGEHLLVNGKKMSKTRGNILYTENIYSSGFTPSELRFFLTSSVHYRKKLDFTMENMEKSSAVLKKIRRKIKTLLEREDTAKSAQERSTVWNIINRVEASFQDAMNDDLSLAKAVIKLDNIFDSLLKIKPEGLFPDEIAALKNHIEKIDTVTCFLLN